jgi:hypothetical protein
MSVNHKIQHMVRLETIIHGLQRGKSYLPLSEMPLAGTDPEGPTLIFYAALQHGFHFTFYSFRASAAHIVSPHLPLRL